jgi:hypothetical protein
MSDPYTTPPLQIMRRATTPPAAPMRPGHRGTSTSISPRVVRWSRTLRTVIPMWESVLIPPTTPVGRDKRTPRRPVNERSIGNGRGTGRRGSAARGRSTARATPTRSSARSETISGVGRTPSGKNSGRRSRTSPQSSPIKRQKRSS